MSVGYNGEASGGRQAIDDISTKARRGTGKRKGFCVVISIDIHNAFNTARWKTASDDDAGEGSKLSVTNDRCLSEQQVGDIQERQMDIRTGMSVNGFADDALIVCAAEDVGILKLRINKNL